jgi:hypothetical protein
MICDFCLSPNVRWSYPAVPTPLDSAIFIASDGDFAACDACHGLIAAGNLVAFADRIVREQRRHAPPGSEKDGGVVVYPHPSVQRRRAMQNILYFFEARTGPPVMM